MKLEITYLDGSSRIVQVTALERIAWEQYARAHNLPLNPRFTADNNGGPGKVDVERFPIDTWQTYLAYAADTKTLPLPRPTFEDWAATIAQAQASDNPTPDPTPAAATPAAYVS